MPVTYPPETVSHESEIFRLASEYVEAKAAIDPFSASMEGILGYDDRVPDYSPEGAQSAFATIKGFERKLSQTTPENEADRIARDVLLAHLASELRGHESGDWLADLNIIASPLQTIRDVFDMMSVETTQDWEHRRSRLVQLPATIEGYQRTLAKGLATGTVAAKRQAVECAKQCSTRSRQFSSMLLAGSEHLPTALRRELEAAATLAGAAYRNLGSWLTDLYAPGAAEHDGVGAERYARESSRYIGGPVDPLETYYWGLEQVDEIHQHMLQVAQEIAPGQTVAAVMDLLDHDPDRAITGEANLVEFLQNHMDNMLEKLDGKHFDIAPAGRRLEQMIAPDGGAAAQYYSPPSEDWTRPGRCWFPTNGNTVFPMWGEITTANHEGVPGHHLQIVASMAAKERLSRFQRMYFLSGHGEGWALYAERLCFELGFLDKPEFVMGWLNGQMLRAIRVVVDIGMHTGKDIGVAVPAASPVCANESWTANTALAYAEHYVGRGFDMASEIDRYLGWPGQAISYKLGEREWLGARSDAQKSLGAKFDLKEFHTKALELGAMGLPQLRTEVLHALTTST